MQTYACDGLTGRRVSPAAVVLPLTTEQAAQVVAACAQANVPFVARGAGTGLSGGALPVAEGVVIGLSRMRADPRYRPREPPGHRATRRDQSRGEQGGAAARVLLCAGSVIAAGLHHRWERRRELRWGALPEVRLHHAPRSRRHVRHRNRAHRASRWRGARCARDTTCWDRDRQRGNAGYRDRGRAADRARARSRRRPCSRRSSTMGDAGEAVSRIIAAGITPAAIEMMDRLAIQACEEIVHAGYPDCGAALIVELDGPGVESERVPAPGHRHLHGKRCDRDPRGASEAERALIWKARKAAFASMGRISPSYYVQDGVIPRTRLRDVLEFDQRRCRRATAFASPTSSMQVTATSIRWCSTTIRSRVQGNARSSLPV